VEKPSTPYVAVIGGLRHLDETAQASAKQTGIEIGKELAAAGFGLVVYFSNELSLEPHVVAGYVDAVADGAGTIRIRYAESQRGQVRFKEEAARPDMFEHRLFPSQDWEAPFYHSLTNNDEVDALVLLGGSTTTLIAGQIAIARRLPILAIDKFGGAAQKICSQLALASSDLRYDVWGARPAKEFAFELKKKCSEVTAQKRELAQRERTYNEIAGRRQKVNFAAGAFAGLMLSMFFGLVYTPFIVAYPLIMFLGLISAGATGALVRAVLWGGEDSEPVTSLLLGSVAGFVVGLAYLIPQWVGAPGVLAPKLAIISATDKIQFASSVLVSISAGVGFDSVFGRLKKQSQDVAIGPPH
jgi:hypothetical protein